MLPSEAMEESKMGKDKQLSSTKTKVTARRQGRRPANGTRSTTDCPPRTTPWTFGTCGKETSRLPEEERLLKIG